MGWVILFVILTSVMGVIIDLTVPEGNFQTVFHVLSGVIAVFAVSFIKNKYKSNFRD